MGGQTTITLHRSDKERLDEARFRASGASLIGLLEETENDPLRIDPLQLEGISRVTAERTVDLFEERVTNRSDVPLNGVSVLVGTTLSTDQETSRYPPSVANANTSAR